MSDCCSTTEKHLHPKKFTCPANQKDYIEVQLKTILHHVKNPWQKTFSEEKYYFCTDPECEIIYFGLKGSTITKDELRTPVGIKEDDQEALICYCFGVSKRAAEQPEIKEFVKQQTKEGLCACDIQNPSGRCCLKDFPK